MDVMQLAPYNDTMRLGQGYNSFLQLPCVDGAVKIDQLGIQTHVARADPSASVSQVVSYNSRLVERISDVARGMNVSAASSIKSGTIGISGSSLSVDEAKFADSDLNAVISVKVINRKFPFPDDSQLRLELAILIVDRNYYNNQEPGIVSLSHLLS